MRVDHQRPAAPAAARAAAGWVVVQPRYRRRFLAWGLATAGDFLDLPGVIVSGHADRHVVRVVLGRGRKRVVGYLKREHRVPWPVRLANLKDGFGWVSKSRREAVILRDLRRAGLPAPRCLAHGADDAGRAFVLVASVKQAVDLRTFLYRDGGWSGVARRELAARIGEALARIHASGFDCPDLSSKHVLIRRRGLSPVVIDWQRTRRARRVRWPVRLRELAALNATLADELATQRDRLRCLRAYLLAALGHRPALRTWAAVIARQDAKLRDRRTARELRCPPLDGTSQRLRWIDGERLAVTARFWRDCHRSVPRWLDEVSLAPIGRTTETELQWRGRRVVLRQFPPSGPVRRWWNWLRGRHEVAPGPRLGGELFRRERLGESGPRPLAFGQRPDGGSFILFDPCEHRGPAADV